MLPQEFLQRMEHLLGAEYPAFLKCYEEKPNLGLRVNTLKASVPAFAQSAPFHLTPVAWEPDGFYYEDTDAPGRHPFHEAGVYYIQEPSAMAVAAYLDAQPGERILDLCAAPGGKSTQLAAAMQGQGLLVSNEIHPARAKVLSANIERMGIRNCMVTNEPPQALAGIWEEYFDRILVDAPCSGEGMFRKNEDACEEWSIDRIAHCAGRQLEILSCAASMLRPGGRIVYSTCTFAPEENEGTVSRFLALHPEFAILPAPKYEGMSGGVAAWFSDASKHIEDAVRLFPHRLSGEGHFLAVLQKANDPDARCEGFCANGIEKGISEKECREYIEFAGRVLKAMPSGKLVRFGDQLYLAPHDMPATKKLKVLRPGLHLGTLKKNRFEPSHALALALRPEDVRLTYNLAPDGDEIRAYLSGQTLPAEGENGWYLITVGGYSIGWSKLTGGIMKNHYPKGLRIHYMS